MLTGLTEWHRIRACVLRLQCDRFEQYRVQSTMCTMLVTMRDRSCGQVKNYNVHYGSDLNYTLEMCRWLLKPLGVWTLIYHHVSRAERVVSLFLQLTCFSCLLFVILPSAYNMFFMEEDVQNIVKLFGPVGFCTFSTIKYCILGIKRNMFSRCIKHVEKDWKIVRDPYHRAIMLKQASISRFLITVCVLFLYTGGMSYHTVMQFLSKDKTNANVTVRPITYPCFEFLNTQSSPTYEIVFFLHCVSALVQYTITSAGYSLAAIFVTHICGQIQIQITRLNELIDDDSDEKNNFPDCIGSIVRDHAEVLRFSKDVEEALREVCLTEIIESTVIMCLLEYYCLMEWANSDTIAILTYVMLLVSFTFNIFIFCYIGEILSEQCSRMGPAVYGIQWYNLPPRKAYNLILLNAIALYPPKLTAGKIIDLSLSMFGTVVKTSVIYLNLLRTFATW
ncbi:odorant receptor 4-like [Lasioglossum baleicum]|uniref:odorant receptor 4-like n=1 Tax=Lasioglossum baleicum TaxID=434251 RepID=UPI003FCD9DFC